MYDRFDPAAPVRFDPEWNAWMVYDYAQVRQILRPGVSRVEVSDWAVPANPSFSAPWALDGPQWTRLRSHIEGPYRDDRLDAPVPELAGAASRYLHTALAADSGRVELIEGFALPYAVTACAMSMGVRDADTASLVGWLLETAEAQALGTFEVPPDGVAYFRNLVARYRLRPPAGLLADLLTAGLSDPELIGLLWTHIIDSADTLASQLGITVHTLIDQNLFSRVRNERALVGNAIEAALWWNPAFPYIRRRLRMSVTVGGVGIPADADVVAWLSAANRSPKLLAGKEFRISGKRARHVSFGLAPRVCVGAALARRALAAGLNTVLDMVPGTVQIGGEPRYQLILNNSLRELWLEFPPGDTG